MKYTLKSQPFKTFQHSASLDISVKHYFISSDSVVKHTTHACPSTISSIGTGQILKY